MSKDGLIVLLSGASSVGKGRIRDTLMADKDLNLFYSISVTTRPRKDGEEDGKDYYFVTHKDFAEAVKNKELLEYTEFNGYYYGTPVKQVDFLISQHKNVLVEVEAQGVGQIKLRRPESLAFFILPKSMEELEKHIRERYKDDEADVQKRLSKAEMEMELAPLFRNTVTNEDTEAAVATIKKVIMDEITK